MSVPVALQDERVSRLALVSPALSDTGWEQLKGYHKPKFLVIGDADFVIPLERFRQRIQEVPEPRQYQVIPGADHFWWGYTEVVAEKVAGFFAGGFRRVD